MNNAINMLPCPMCGCSSINVKNEQPTDNSGGYFIECPDCGISTSLRYACGDDPIPLLAEQWNRRATAQCLHQIAEPATTESVLIDGTAYVVHAEVAAELLRLHIELQTAPQAVQPAVPTDADIDAAMQAFDWDGWIDQDKAKRAFTREVLARWAAPAQPAEGVPATATVPAAIDPGQCAQDVFDNGVSVGLFEIPKATANALCAAISAATGARLDWHYIAGRVHMKALAATQPAAQGLDAPESEYQRGYRHGYNRRDAEVQGALL